MPHGLPALTKYLFGLNLYCLFIKISINLKGTDLHNYHQTSTKKMVKSHCKQIPPITFVNMSISQCLKISISQYLNTSISQYRNMSIYQNLRISNSRILKFSNTQTLNISISQYLSIPISQYLNISIS